MSERRDKTLIIFFVVEVVLLAISATINLAVALPVALVGGIVAVLIINKNPVLFALGTGVVMFCILWGDILSVFLPAPQDVFIGFAIFVFLIRLLQGREIRWHWSSLSILVAAFVMMIIVSIGVGVARGNATQWIIMETHSLLYYGLFFVILGSLQTRNDATALFWFILTGGSLVCIEYIFLLTQRSTFQRVSTYHADMFPLLLGCAISLSMYAKRLNVRGLAIAVGGLLIVALLISLARAEWVAAVLGSAILFFLFLKYRRLSAGYWFSFVFCFLLIGAVLFFSESGFVSGYFGSQSTGEISKRAESMESALEDTSLLMRVELNSIALQRFLRYPIMGAGIGDVVRYRTLDTGPVWSLDTSHLQILWKMGLVGFIIFASLLFTVLKRSLYVFRRTDDDFYKWFSAAVFSGFCGLIVLSFFSAALTKYNLNLVWVMVIAAIEHEGLRIDKMREAT
jgi:hypothetical protein